MVLVCSFEIRNFYLIYEIIKLHIWLVSAVIWLAKNKIEQNQALDCCEAFDTMENMIAAINVATITTIASKLKMK